MKLMHRISRKNREFRWSLSLRSPRTVNPKIQYESHDIVGVDSVNRIWVFRSGGSGSRIGRTVDPDRQQDRPDRASVGSRWVLEAVFQTLTLPV